MPLGIGFNPKVFAEEFVARRYKRWLNEFFTGLGEERLVYLIQNNKDFTDYIPPEKLAAQTRHIDKRFLAVATPDKVYSWLPEETRETIESFGHGKEWAYRQMDLLTRMATS